MSIKTEIKFRGFNITKLSQTINLLREYAKETNLKHDVKSIKLNTKKITVLKSPHVHKKARDQYEIRTFKKVLILDGSLAETKTFLQRFNQEVNEDISYNISFSKETNII